MEDTEDDGIGAANWLDVTHAMLNMHSEMYGEGRLGESNLAGKL